MKIELKHLYLVLEIFFALFASWVVLAHVGVFPIPEVKSKDLWMTSNVALSVAAILFIREINNK